MVKKQFSYDVPFAMLPPPGMSIFPIIDKKSRFYKNCKQQRKKGAKICQDCPFRQGIEEQESNGA